MKRLLLFAILVLVAGTVGSLAQSDLSDEELLQAMDYARFGAFFPRGASTTTFTVEIVADRPDSTKQAAVQVSFHWIDGAQYTRIDFLQPEEMAGQVFLATPEGVFFWTPDLVTPLKVSGRFEVFGDANVVEVAGIGFQGAYAVTERQAVTVDGGPPTLEVKLEAKYESIAFPFATVIADAASLRPVTLRLFALSGDPFHDVTYEEYDEIDGAPYMKKLLIENLIVTTNKTLLTITNVQNGNLPDELFDPASFGGAG